MGLLNKKSTSTKKTTSSSTSSKVLKGTDASKFSASGLAKIQSKGYTFASAPSGPLQKPVTKTTTTPTTTPTPVATQTKTVATPTKTYASTGGLKTSLGSVLGTNLGGGSAVDAFGRPITPTFEFSVLPNSKQQGVQAFGMPKTGMANSTATVSAGNTQAQNAQIASKVAQDQREGYEGMAMSVGNVALGPVGGKIVSKVLSPSILAKIGAKFGSKAEPIINALSSMGTKAEAYANKMLTGGGSNTATAVNALTKVDDVVKTAVNTSRIKTAVTALRSTPVISSLGAIVGAGVIGAGITSYNSAQTRSAITAPTSSPTNSSTPTATPTVNKTSTPTTDTTKTTEPEVTNFAETPTSQLSSDGGISQLSAPTSGGSSVSGGGSVGGGSVGAGYGGGTGGSWGTPVTKDGMTQAQAKAMELQRQSQTPNVGTTPITDEVELDRLAKIRDDTRALVDQFGTEAFSMPEYKQNVQTLLAGNLANLNKMRPPIPDPVTETQEQAEFADNSDDPTGVRAYMDQTRKNLGMTDLESSRIDIMKQLQAVQETYQQVIDDIKANPNLPKGLAARRLTEVFEDQKFAANALISQLDIIEKQLKDANDRLNQEMGIYKMEQDEEEAERERRMDQFGYMVDSNAVGALSAKEIRQWAQATGIPESAITEMKKKATDPVNDYDIQYTTDDAGNYYAIYTNKKDPLETPTKVNLGQIGKATKEAKGSTKEENEAVVYTEKTLPVSVKQELIATIKANPRVSAEDLYATFPEISEEVIDTYLGQYEVPVEDNEPWYKFW
jgi:hypothetical protein